MRDDLALHVVCRLFYSSLVPGVLSARSKALLGLKRKKMKPCSQDMHKRFLTESRKDVPVCKI